MCSTKTGNESGAGRWIRYEGQTYSVANDGSALEAMLAGGANLFFSCRKGTCRSCMLEAVSGDPGEAAQARLPAEFRKRNFFLPCMATEPLEVEARVPDLSSCVVKAEVADKAEIGPGVWRILLETETAVDWRPGQYLSIRKKDCAVRSYSIVSSPDDYFIELHIRHYPDGVVSDWLVKDVPVGGSVEFVGPTGTCYYTAGKPERPLLLIGNGTGGSLLMAIAYDALKQGHSGPIRLYHGARYQGGHYLARELAALEEEWPNFSAHCVVVGPNGHGLVETAIQQGADLRDHELFLCGSPDMVEEARVTALTHGAHLDALNSDPFESPVPYLPRDPAKIAAVQPEPELWAALGEGELLTEILRDFYGQVFEDPRLFPFFHKVTKDRLIEKQYSFTADLLTGERRYFGERPFNAHHWMIISDELFDYREKLFFDTVRKYGVPGHLIARWAGLNELFRREIVKTTPRGQWIDGKEVIKPRFATETCEVDTLCDGCQEEVHAGETVRYHLRTGELFCLKCSSLDGSTGA